jgi:outer membrane scaffolding protein for murein synthesis (MipA/OmpV family)
MTKLIRTPLMALPLLFPSAAALAQQQVPPPEKSAFGGDYLTVGAGVAVGPDFEGSSDYAVYPMGAIMGRIGPVTINPRIGGIALDLIPDGDSKVGFSLGPVARARFERTGTIHDPVLALLGNAKTAVEVGGTAGVSVSRIANPYDSLAFSIDVRWDIAKAHRGQTITPSMTYLTPLNQGTAIALSATVEHVDDHYAQYYYDITPANALATGLPVYTAHSGWKSAGATLIGIVDLDGKLLNGGFALIGGVSYMRMLGNIADSPIISERGAANQFIGALGIAYTF